MKKGYNEHLFNGPSIRRFYHMARFRWIKQIIENQSIATTRIIELGCYDCRLLNHLPHKPERYVGVDANVEGGLSLARSKLDGDENISLIETRTPLPLEDIENNFFDTAITMETLEHIPPEILESYLSQLHRTTKHHLVATVPNEKGLVFLSKFLAKKAMLREKSGHEYAPMEVVNATLGRMKKVARDEHKGFDYQDTVRLISKYFKVEGVFGIPFSYIPASLNPTIGILAKK